MPEAQKRELLALLTRHAVPLIEDDVYGEIHFTRERPRPFVALDGGANTIYCSSFSKPPQGVNDVIGTSRRMRATDPGT